MMFTKSYLDHLISPSEWARKSQGQKRIKQHIDFIEKHSKIISETIPCQLNIPYGPRKRECIHIYGIDLPEDAPIFVHFHGGFWYIPEVTPSNNAFIAKHLYSNNVKAIFVGYELCPNATLAEIAENAQKAVTLCLNYAKKHKSKGIHLSGHSAGGQIVAMLFKTFIPSLSAEDQALFKTAFLLTGVFDATSVLSTYINDYLKLDETAAVAESPLRQHLVANRCELIVVVAKYDSPRLLLQGEQMYEYIVKLGFEAEFLFLDDMDHFDVIECLYDDENELTRLILKYCNTK